MVSRLLSKRVLADLNGDFGKEGFSLFDANGIVMESRAKGALLRDRKKRGKCCLRNRIS